MEKETLTAKEKKTRGRKTKKEKVLKRAEAAAFVRAERELVLGEGPELPERERIPREYKWKLADIYRNDEEWEEDFETVAKRATEIDAYKGTLDVSAARMAEFLSLNDEISLTLGKLYVYANMKCHEDTRVSKYQGLANRITALCAEISALSSFMAPELLRMDEKKLRRFLKSKKLSPYAFPVNDILRSRAHVLSDKEEKIMSRAGGLSEIASGVHSALTNADMRFGEIKDEAGMTVELSEERACSFLRSPRRSVRKSAFFALFKPYREMQNTLGAAFSGMLKTAKFFADSRGYASTLEAALDKDNIPVSVYDNLVSTVEANLSPLHRYIKLRQRALKLKDIHMYDLYTPLVGAEGGKIPWSDAKETAYKYLAPLGDEYVAQVKAGLEGGWCDVFSNRGKRGGAYSWGSYATHPYIFMNYNNRLDDVFTLVHEAGHAMHSFCSRKYQPYPTAEYSIFTAEVASTTNEALLLSGLLDETRDASRRAYLLNKRLENIRTTVYRQTMFASFEREVHKREAEGGDATPDGLKKLWRELNAKYYGDDFIVDKELETEWARIPHFYTPFYVYQYATGYSAATALSRGILEEKEPAVKRYIDFLKKGGSDYPIELLKEAGVNMSEPKPIKDAIKLFSRTLDEMEEYFQ